MSSDATDLISMTTTTLDRTDPTWRYGVVAALGLRLTRNDSPQARKAYAFMCLSLLCDRYQQHERQFLSDAANLYSHPAWEYTGLVIVLLASLQTGEPARTPVTQALVAHHVHLLMQAVHRIRDVVREDERIADLFRTLDRTEVMQ